MDNPLGFLFGKDTTTARVVDEPPLVEMDLLRYLQELLIVLWIIIILGMELSILVITYFLSMNYAGCLSVHVSQLNR